MNGGPGALLLLLGSVYLLLAFFTGRLEWLFNLGKDVQAGYSSSAPTSSTPAATALQPRYRYANA